MNDRKDKARIAGVLYLLFGITSAIEMSIPSVFIVNGDAAATVAKIASSQLLYRFYIGKWSGIAGPLRLPGAGALSTAQRRERATRVADGGTGSRSSADGVRQYAFRVGTTRVVRWSHLLVGIRQGST